MSTPGVVRASNVLYAIFVLSFFVSIIGKFSNLEDIAGVVLNERERAHVDGMAPSSNHFPCDSDRGGQWCTSLSYVLPTLKSSQGFTSSTPNYIYADNCVLGDSNDVIIILKWKAPEGENNDSPPTRAQTRAHTHARTHASPV